MMLPIARKPASVNRRGSPLLVPDECQSPCRPVVALPPRGAVAARDKLNHLQGSLPRQLNHCGGNASLKVRILARPSPAAPPFAHSPARRGRLVHDRPSKRTTPPSGI